MNRFLLSLALVLVFASPSWAVRIFTEGFEHNAALTSTTFSTTAGTVSISATAPHSGTYRMDTVNTAGNEYAQRTITAASHAAGTTLYTRFYFRADDATPTAETQIFANGNAVPNLGLQLLLETNGKVRLKNVNTGTTADSAGALSDNTWYRLETEHILSETVGSMTLRIYDDATPFATLIETVVLATNGAEDTIPATTANISILRFGKTASASVFSYDDIAVNDNSGSFQTTYPGQGKLCLLKPDSNVSIKSENTAGAADTGTFATIDEFPGTIDDTDYNTFDSSLDATDNIIGSDATQFDRYGLTDACADVTANATITLLEAHGRFGSNQTSATHLQFLLWDEASTKTTGATTTAAVNGWRTNYGVDVECFVYDATGKTTANLASFNMGYQALTDTITSRPRRLSVAWVDVEWTEVASTSAMQSSQGFLGAIIK